jgi:hypothetical protein
MLISARSGDQLTFTYLGASGYSAASTTGVVPLTASIKILSPASGVVGKPYTLRAEVTPAGGGALVIISYDGDAISSTTNGAGVATLTFQDTTAGPMPLVVFAITPHNDVAQYDTINFVTTVDASLTVRGSKLQGVFLLHNTLNIGTFAPMPYADQSIKVIVGNSVYKISTDAAGTINFTLPKRPAGTPIEVTWQATSYSSAGSRKLLTASTTFITVDQLLTGHLLLNSTNDVELSAVHGVPYISSPSMGLHTTLAAFLNLTSLRFTTTELIDTTSPGHVHTVRYNAATASVSFDGPATIVLRLNSKIIWQSA